jgi:hypothetical protein
MNKNTALHNHIRETLLALGYEYDTPPARKTTKRKKVVKRKLTTWEKIAKFIFN